MPARWTPPLILLAAACTDASHLEPWGDAPRAERATKSDCDGAWTGVSAEAGAAAEQLWAQSVGSLAWDAGVGGGLDGARWCSGALIAPSIFLSAGHCFDVAGTRADYPGMPTSLDDPEAFCDNMHVQFNYQTAGGALPDDDAMPTFACASVLAGDYDDEHDFVLLRLEGEPGAEFGYLELSPRAAVGGESLTLIGHPDGREKEIVRGEVIATIGAELWHDLDTEGGLSGGPLLDSAGRILGVHTNSICAGDENYGAGKPTDRIIDRAPWLARWDWFDQRESDEVEGGDGFGASSAVGDFDGDGYDDVAVGAPGDSEGTAAMAGEVSVRYGGPYGPDAAATVGLRQRGRSAPEAYDFFGWTLAVGDFDGDGYDDLAVGSPYEDWGSAINTGVVQIYYGGPGGLGDTPGDAFVPSDFGAPNARALFGAALAVGDTDGDGHDDLAGGEHSPPKLPPAESGLQPGSAVGCWSGRCSGEVL